MTSGAITPNLAEFRAVAGRQPVVTLSRRLLADGETPVGVYRKLAGERPGTFLLESAEHGGVWSRYSFVGVRSLATLTERDGAAAWLGTPPAGVAMTGDPLAVLAATASKLRTPSIATGEDNGLAGLPPLTGGLVGYLGYDIVRRLERLPSLATDDLAVPELAMMLTTDVAVLDHADGSIVLVTNVIPQLESADGGAATAALDAAYHRGAARLDAMTLDLTRPAAPTAAVIDTAVEPHCERRTSSEDYQTAVKLAKEQIFAGEAFQVVVSQRFERTTTASALDIYRVLRVTNPSPYMYLLRFDDFDIVGSSPEVLVKVDGTKAMLHPIAGTRPRGATPEQDAQLAAELLADPKERAEHVMLVDLGRNDLGRICQPGTVEVLDFMSIERYSHVMHIVSTVVGTVPADRAALDVLAASFPAGTVSGAPKPRAMEIIEELEPTRRGPYAGAVGYVGFSGKLDTAIAIRTALLRDGVAYVQAGAGIVADSDPAAEDAECVNKAAAVLRAIAAAETLRPAR